MNNNWDLNKAHEESTNWKQANNIFKKIRKKVSMATKLKGGGGKVLVAGPLKKNIFCGFP